MKAKQRTLGVLLFLILLAGGVFALLMQECQGRTGCQCGRRWGYSAGGSFGQ